MKESGRNPHRIKHFVSIDWNGKAGDLVLALLPLTIQ